MTEDLLFSVITVCYNAEGLIGDTIESVLQQTWKEFEYILVDGASTDATTQFLEEYGQKDGRIRWYSEPDHGIYHAMNKGIRYAHGRFLYFLNAGDEFHNRYVLEEIAQVIMDSQADIIVGNIGFKTGSGIKETQYFIGEALTDLLQSGDCICHQAVFASSSCLTEGFDEKFKICADYNWLCQMVNHKKKIAKAEILIADYDPHGISNQVCYQKLHWNESFEVVRRNFPALDTKQLTRIQKLFIQERKNRFLYECMNQWVVLKQRRVDISSFFVRQEIFEIAIYGMHYMGQRLLDELEGSVVKVKYVVDQKASAQVGKNIACCLSNALNPVEAIVITPIFDYIEIKKDILQKLDCKIFSIEDVLYYRY